MCICVCFRFVSVTERIVCLSPPSSAGFLRQLRGSGSSGPVLSSSAASSSIGFSSGAAAPRSDLLQRLNSFLPQLAAANAQLQTKIATEGSAAVNIEAVGEADPHILMVGATTTCRMLLGGADESSHCFCVAASLSSILGSPLAMTIPSRVRARSTSLGFLSLPSAGRACHRRHPWRARLSLRPGRRR